MEAIELRHILHQNPEISFREFETQKILLNALKSLNNNNLKIYKIAGTGVIAIYEPKKGKPFIIYRADIDGLPIEEKTDWKYASKNSNMHACGHDIHMSIAYDLIKKITENNIDQNFAFVFQPGEETGAGARYVLDEIEELPVKYAIALHVTDEYDFKTISTTKGTLFAAATEIDVTFYGKASHVAFYENGIDSIKMASNFLNEFYSLKFEDSLVAFGKIAGGNARNIVSQETTIMGSIRTNSSEKTKSIISILENLAEKTAKENKGSFSISKGSEYPPVIVNDELFFKFKDFLKSTDANFVECNMKFTGEDFGYFSQEYPSLMFWIGTRIDEKYGLHNPKFLPKDDVIPYYSNIIFNFLKELTK
ncbi:amidohydrolase [Thermosipho melanesiensis]|uniref:Amidohydrolase n=2 Tax=Thermosipho melanesiensis TaxID=46541 RepID=A6LLV4_THEM4|nr:M20 family metallopeptidase [Thermosipho melanesiensis]ABR30905.1 amidohydrolase [Thermosipho melanesiensis BI429]APT74024.1 peptidase M20 [Thermosipho melanesiensis]OOC35952.1 amidohydrolase [Thermosipho melanesiensis]OOC38454.1 amidohydrolase [Thermosipho melanesiensis]OOC38915.1 amidohydrolase [Thermosipho melanesiensis]